jgi:large subunit ribosomal protein L30
MVKAKKAETVTEVVQDSTPKTMLVIRIRGAPHCNYKIEDTMKMLRLHHVNHAVLLQNDKTIAGMLNRVKDYVAFGEVDEKTVLKILRTRALLVGNKPLTEEHLVNKTEFKTYEELAKAVAESKLKVKDIYNLKPVFRFGPPKGGFRGSIKKAFNSGGPLGYVGAYINSLANKMI